MKIEFGTVSVDTDPCPDVDGPCLTFTCKQTGLHGTVTGTAATLLEKCLEGMGLNLAQSILRAAGNTSGGDVSLRVVQLLAMKPFVGFGYRASLSYPGKLEIRENGQVFVDSSGEEHKVHSRCDWRQRHGEITGAPTSKSRDFFCGGAADSPKFYGGEYKGTSNASVHAYGDLPGDIPGIPKLVAKRRPGMR